MLHCNRSIAAVRIVAAIFVAVVSASYAQSQDYQRSAAHQQARARMKPIGSPSASDRYRRPAQSQSDARFRETAFNTGFHARPTQSNQVRTASESGRSSQVRQVAMMQEGFETPPLGSDAIGAPPIPVPDPNSSLPPNGGTNLMDRSLPSPSDMAGGLQPGDLRGRDLAPINQPQLQSGGFATLENCNCVSGPSGYSAASGFGCGSNLGYVSPASGNLPLANGLVPGYAAPPAQIAAPAAMPVLPRVGGAFGQAGLGQAGLGQAGLGGRLGSGTPPRALVSLGQQVNPVQVGQGLWGQPVAYVPGQSVRNWIRYFFP